MKRTRTVPVGIALAAVTAFVIGLLVWRQLRRPPAGESGAVAQATPAPAVAFPGDRVFPAPPAAPQASVAPAEGLVLDIVAKQQCWVAVQADGVRVIDRVLARGETQRLSAQRELVLSVGNAGGVGITINGRNGVALGRNGEVRRNIVITHQSLPSLVQGGPAPPPAPVSGTTG